MVVVAGATTVAPESMVRLPVVEALLLKVFVLAPLMVTFASAEVPVKVPPIDCAEELLKIMFVVAEAVVVPLFV
jgi:hypothetical protein